MTPERVASKLQSIRDEIDRADLTKVPAAQIGAILIAIGTLTDIVEAMQPKRKEADPMASVYADYQNERRIDEYAAYQREQE